MDKEKLKNLTREEIEQEITKLNKQYEMLNNTLHVVAQKRRELKEYVSKTFDNSDEYKNKYFVWRVKSDTDLYYITDVRYPIGGGVRIVYRRVLRSRQGGLSQRIYGLDLPSFKTRCMIVEQDGNC